MNHLTKWGYTAPLARRSCPATALMPPIGTFNAPLASSFPSNSIRASSHVCPNECNKDSSKLSSAAFVFSLDSIFKDESGRRDRRRRLIPTKKDDIKRRSRISAAHRGNKIATSAPITPSQRSDLSIIARRPMGGRTSREPCSNQIRKLRATTFVSSKSCCKPDDSEASHQKLVNRETISVDDLSVHRLSFETVSSWESSSSRLCSASSGSDRGKSSGLSSLDTDEPPGASPRRTPMTSFPSQSEQMTSKKREENGVGVSICNRNKTGHQGKDMASSLSTRIELLRLTNPYCYGHYPSKRGVGASSGNTSRASSISMMRWKGPVNSSAEKYPSRPPLDFSPTNRITSILSPSGSDLSIFIASPNGKKGKVRPVAETLEAARSAPSAARVAPPSDASTIFTAENRDCENEESTAAGLSEGVRTTRSQFSTKQVLQPSFRKGFPLRSARVVRERHANERDQKKNRVTAQDPEFTDILAGACVVESSQPTARSMMRNETTHPMDMEVSISVEREGKFAQGKVQTSPRRCSKAVKVIRTVSLVPRGRSGNPKRCSRGLRVWAGVEVLNDLQRVWESSKDIEDII
ncbi:unnamed protein product [Phytomonas sp. EM1]|nr:unnamed protein product [Phytomonas sp. EM1]|eukprot:CCW59814.1 unnamed protein product [Phytomonas sp. isolate EM1]